MAKKKTPKNNNKPWSEEDLQLLIKYAPTMAKPELAKALDRTRDAIKQKIRTLEMKGIIPPVPRK
ncbi:MAG: HTH domain-containing protein [Spirosomaceae bacterium]|jgi:biotin operon repressor|nr:HTH domain-containing protein [Spirosomataceae bacterium]